MNAVDFFLAPQNAPFLWAAAIVVILLVVEVLGLLLGAGLSDVVDSLMPDLDVPDAELDFFGEGLSWLNAGRVPFVILIVAFLGVFATGGFVLQLVVNTSSFLLPWVIAVPVVFVVSVPVTRVFSRFLAKVVPRVETYAVGDEALVGRIAKVSLGPVEREVPGKARVLDPHGNVVYVRVRAARDGKRFEQGREVLLVALEGTLFDVIEAPESLSPDKGEQA